METPNNDDLSISNIVFRLTSKMPVFWKRMHARMIILGTLCSLLLAAEHQLNVGFTDTFIAVLKYGIAVGVTGTFFSQLTIKN